MGLDAVELVMAVEDRFGITIRDDEATAIVTVGDLTRLVLSRIAARELHVCETFRAFLVLRSEIRHLMSDTDFRVRPHQRIADVIPVRKRRALWTRLEHRLGTPPPSLKRPTWLRILLVVTTTCFFVLGFAPAAIDLVILPLSLPCAFLLSFAVAVITRPFCWVPPVAMATMGDVARAIAGTTVALGASPASEPTSWVPEVMRDMIAEELGVDRNMVEPTARFIKDLGMS